MCHFSDNGYRFHHIDNSTAMRRGISGRFCGLWLALEMFLWGLTGLIGPYS